ncbi:PQQ-binding-like beta-propeller repeat protein [candidate division KSB3 bacterium]|nr:PQQ-binding-like beta-propeller repeat protein [candidate division KSB3 bacterium]
MGQDSSSQFVVALDAKTGEELWKRTTNPAYDGLGYPGPRATPTIDGENVYIFDGVGKLMCLKAEDGSVVWEYNALEKFGAENMKWGVASSPLIDGDKLYLHLGPSQGSSVLCLNKMTGEKIWASQSASGGYSSPVLREIDGKKTLVSFLATGPVGIDPETGKKLWSAPWKTNFDVHAATPLVYDDYVFVASGYNRGCMLAKAQNGKATVVKTDRNMRSQMSSPRYYNEFIYGFDDNMFAAVNPLTLEQPWRERYGKGAFTIADDKAYILHERRGLTLAKLSPEGITVLSHVPSTPLDSRRNWTMPVIANGLMYCRNESILVCYNVSEK